MTGTNAVRWGMVAMALVTGVAAAQDTATLRGREGRVVEVESASGSGVIGTVSGARLEISWDRVRSISGGATSANARFLEAGDLLWRGIGRLDRGDPLAAIGVLEQSYEVFGTEPGATGAVAADAMLSARLALSDAERSVVPWLHILEHDLAVVDASGPRLTGIDRETGLVPSLPPVFETSRTAARSAAEVAGEGFDRWTDGPNRRLAEAYASALLIAAGQDPPPLDWQPPTEGTRLARAMVEARSPDARRRHAARAELQSFLDRESASWMHAWCHAGIGMSLLQGSPSERLAGIGHLLVVPSVHADDQPYLAGVCLANAAAVLGEEGRDEAAARLIDTLERLNPRHPSLSLPALRGVRSSAASASLNGNGT